VTSFAILHELTAVVPVVSIFYALRALGTGDAIVAYVRDKNQSSSSGEFQKAIFTRANTILDDGQARAVRFGRRYGLWGLDESAASNPVDPTNLMGNVANAAVSYGLIKVCGYFFFQN
jgi:hypothetical protein